MPLAGAHAIITILVLAGARKFLKIRFSNKLIVFGGILGLLPDLDIPIALAINWLFGTSFYFHKVYANALAIPLLLFAIAFALRFAKHEKAAVVILAAAISYFTHIALDCFFSVGLTANILPGGEMIGICRNLLGKEMLIVIDAMFIGAALLYLAHRQKR